MERRALPLVSLVGAALLLGCARGASHSGPAHARAPRGTSSTSGIRIFTAAELGRDGRSLLEILRQQLPNIQIGRTGECPSVYLRGRSTILSSSAPGIYVDGAEMANTCILQSISTPDLARVEVYPFGITHRPGYRVDPYGLILIFTRRAYR